MDNRIKEVIRKKGIKQIYICKELGINESVLSLIINILIYKTFILFLLIYNIMLFYNYNFHIL